MEKLPSKEMMVEVRTNVKFDLRGERKGVPIKIQGTVHNQFAVSGTWMRGSLHSHLNNWQKEAPAVYKEIGYDFLVAMDHDEVVMTESRNGMVCLPGAEMSPGHLLALGLKDVDSLITEGVGRFSQTEEMVRQIVEQGGAAFLAHPLWSGWTIEQMRGLCAAGLTGMEVINSHVWGSGDTVCSDQLWHSLLSPDIFLAASGGDDAHSPGEFSVDTPQQARRRTRLGWTGVLARDLSADGLLEGLKKGRTYASEGPEFHSVDLHPDGKLVVRCSPCVACHFRGKQKGYGGRSVFPPDDRELAEEFTFDFTVNGYRVKDNIVVIIEDEHRRKAYLSPLKLDLSFEEV